MPFHLIQGDLIKQQTDAIVNPANSSLLMGGGVCGLIFTAAGIEEMENACGAIGHCSPGSAVITPGFALPASFVIHAVGPVWQGGGSGEAEILAQPYRTSLALAAAHSLKSISFPLISSGIYGYPKNQAIQIAIGAIRDFLAEEEDLEVFLVLHDRDSIQASRKIDPELTEYIRFNYEGEESFSQLFQQEIARAEAMGAEIWNMLPEETEAGPLIYRDMSQAPSRKSSFRRSQEEKFRKKMELPPSHSMKREYASLDDVLQMPKLTFTEALLKHMDTRGLRDPEVYHRANLDRKLFNKIVNNKGYQPNRRTAMAICVGLQLDLEEAEELLRKAGFAFSDASIADLVYRYNIQKGQYDIIEIECQIYDIQQEAIRA